MKYLINKEYNFEEFDDGDVIASNYSLSKNFVLNSTTWFIIKLFSSACTYLSANQKYLNHFNYDNSILNKEFEQVFNILIKNKIIIEV